MRKTILKILAVVFAAAAVFTIIREIVSPNRENILYIAFLDEELESERKAELEDALQTLLVTDPKTETISLDDNLYLNNRAMQKIEVLLYNHQMDLFIADRETFEAMAGLGYFEDLSRIPELTGELYTSRYVECAGYLEEEDEEITFEDHSTGEGEILPYGISLKGTDWAEELYQYMEEPVVGFVLERPHEEAALLAVQLLVGEES